ncbi:MAG: hypothetical protein FJ104_13075, partial [Deltaproteobacteria bacterium]|nr:hypothetical protein [Deltaproteobacteria bacterium]
MNDEELRAEIAALSALTPVGAASAELEPRLARLRALYRERPERFGAADV